MISAFFDAKIPAKSAFLQEIQSADAKKLAKNRNNMYNVECW
jgi:hypothetical protein